jgi:hypothetical protein
MFSFTGLWTHGIKPHLGAFLVVTLIIVIFVSAPFIALWRLAKRVPVVGDALGKLPGAAA